MKLRDIILVLVGMGCYALTACDNNQMGDGSPGPTLDNINAPPSIPKGWYLAPGADLNEFFDCLDNLDIGLISAHRGGSYAGYPENALETIQYLLADIPAIIEIDIATSADGVLFLMHDDTLDRTTTGTGNAAAKSWSEIQSLYLRDHHGQRTPFHPPRFSDILHFAKDRTILQLDMKRSARFEDVIAEVKRQRATNRIIYIAYSVGAARKLHRLHPQAMISVSLENEADLQALRTARLPSDKIIAFTGTEQINPQLLSQLNSNRIEVIFGTLGGYRSIDRQIASNGDERRYAQLVRQGVDIIATDRPKKAYEALSRFGPSSVNGQCGINQYTN